MQPLGGMTPVPPLAHDRDTECAVPSLSNTAPLLLLLLRICTLCTLDPRKLV